MTIDTIKHTVSTNLCQKGLFGACAHQSMSSIERRYPILAPPSCKIAAVLCLVYPKNKTLYLAYILRSSKDKRDKHAGQVGFPGGKREEIDTDNLATALREAKEEIGIIPADVEIITHLSELYVPVSNFLIYPFLGFLTYTPIFCIEEREVETLIEIPLHALTPKNRIKMDIPVRDVVLPQTPCYSINEYTIWGATAMITREIEALIQH